MASENEYSSCVHHAITAYSKTCFIYGEDGTCPENRGIGNLHLITCAYELVSGRCSSIVELTAIIITALAYI